MRQEPLVLGRRCIWSNPPPLQPFPLPPSSCVVGGEGSSPQCPQDQRKQRPLGVCLCWPPRYPHPSKPEDMAWARAWLQPSHTLHTLHQERLSPLQDRSERRCTPS